jgi:outer membrane protein OmpA-like peptidoglycan-associated protein
MKKILLALAAMAALGAPAMAMAGHVFVGVGIGGPGYYGGYGYGRGYYGPRYYGSGYYAPYYGYSPYYYPPTVVYQAPETVVEQAPQAYWYYCPPARAYYPYVRECPEGWQAVPAQQAAPPAQGQPQGQPMQPQAGAQQPVPAPGGRVTYRLGDLLFATASADLRPGATATLDAMLASVSKDPNHRIVVEGHTDSKGTDAFNRDLSQRRAEAVRQYFIAHGVAAQRITAVGKGENGPIADNGTAQGRKQNRRVDVIVG